MKARATRSRVRSSSGPCWARSALAAGARRGSRISQQQCYLFRDGATAAFGAAARRYYRGDGSSTTNPRSPRRRGRRSLAADSHARPPPRPRLAGGQHRHRGHRRPPSFTNSGLGCPNWPVPRRPPSSHRRALVARRGRRQQPGVDPRRVRRRCRGLRRGRSAGCAAQAPESGGGPGSPWSASRPRRHGWPRHAHRLNPWVVAPHFLVSMVSVAASTAFWWRTRELPGTSRRTHPPGSAGCASAVWVMGLRGFHVGKPVTGSGPHAGDPRRSGCTFAPQP